MRAEQALAHSGVAALQGMVEAEEHEVAAAERSVETGPQVGALEAAAEAASPEGVQAGAQAVAAAAPAQLHRAVGLVAAAEAQYLQMRRMVASSYCGVLFPKRHGPFTS